MSQGTVFPLIIFKAAKYGFLLPKSQASAFADPPGMIPKGYFKRTLLSLCLVMLLTNKFSSPSPPIVINSLHSNFDASIFSTHSSTKVGELVSYISYCISEISSIGLRIFSKYIFDFLFPRYWIY